MMNNNNYRLVEYTPNYKTGFSHENESPRKETSKATKKMQSIVPYVKARKFGRAWKTNCSRKRRQIKPQKTRMSHLGLNDDIGVFDTSDIGRFNKLLLQHFAFLAKRTCNDDEIELEYVDELINKNADINCRGKNGQGILHEVAGGWSTDVALYLLERDADVNIKDNLGITPLHVAAAEDYPEMVKILLENGADIEAMTSDEQQTPLHFAARNDAVNSVKALVQAKANKEAQDHKKRTPLFLAAVLNRSDVEKYLISVNADVTVVDESGQFCLTRMITNSESAARLALDQYHKQDRVNREEFFRLYKLEVPEISPNNEAATHFSNAKGGKHLGKQGLPFRLPVNITRRKEKSFAQTPLEVIVQERNLDLIMHPVIKKLVEVKWEQFGRWVAFQKLGFDLLFVIIWTALGVGHPWYVRPFYKFPQDAWRVVFLVFGCLLTAIEVFDEVKQILASRRHFNSWKDRRELDIDSDMKLCETKWNKEVKYYKNQKEKLSKRIPSYFNDVWNYFDWIVYFLILIVVVLHLVDTFLPGSARQAPCCTVDFVCNDTSIAVCNTGIVNNANLSVWNNRFFVLLIIFLWLRIMKFTRAFRFLGPFMVMLEQLTMDILRFLYLYGEFYIPYSCAFWMIFGNVESIPSMSTVDLTLFSLFRITLVDDYEFQEMHAYDIVMAYILIGTFLGISAILCLNLFIALLSDTFQRVYDQANANAVMQRASSLLLFEENLSNKKKEQFREHLKQEYADDNREEEDYSTYVAEEEDVKQMTIQIKSQLEELMEIVREQIVNPKPLETNGTLQSIRTELRDTKRMMAKLQNEQKAYMAKKPPAHSTLMMNDIIGSKAKKDRNSRVYDRLIGTRRPNKRKVAPRSGDQLPSSSPDSVQAFEVSASSADTESGTSHEEIDPVIAGVRITDLSDDMQPYQA